MIGSDAVKSDTQGIIESLIHSPKLPKYVEDLNLLVREERLRRERFYEDISEACKAEFIGGEVILHSPVKKRHNEVSGLLYHLLDAHVRERHLGFVGHEKILIALTRNDYEPDVCYFSSVKSITFTKDQSKFPAPDFVAEILSTFTEKIDRGVKFEDYAAHGVSEYWIIDSEKEFIEQYELKDQHYEMIVKVKTGIIDSIAVSGFGIPVRAIFDENEYLASLRSLLE